MAKTKYVIMLVIVFSLLTLFAATITLSQETAPLSVTVVAPKSFGIRPYEDGVMITGRAPYTYVIYIEIKNLGTESVTDVVVVGDARGTIVGGPESEEYLLTPAYSAQPSIIKPDKTQERGTWSGNEAIFRVQEIKPGETWGFAYNVFTPNKVPSPVTLKLKIKVSYKTATGTNTLVYEKEVRVENPPVWRLWFVIGIAIVTFVGLVVAGKLGFFSFYTTIDLVTISIVAAAQAVWVQIIGRQLVFPVLNRIPLTYNFAVGDFPYILLLITAAMLVGKPGAVSLTLFIYNIVSEIIYYGINPLWWAYPFAQGLVADFYLLVRGRAAFTNKVGFFVYRKLYKGKSISEILEKLPTLKGLDVIDGALVGFLRGFFMQISLYLVFYPNLFKLYYAWGYALYWMTIPWAIGNMIEGAISVPIVRKIKEAVMAL